MSKPVFTLHFDGANVRTEADFHEAVSEQTGIEWYGANLDAFCAMLVSVIPCAWGAFRIQWDQYDLSMPHEGQRKTLILGIIKKAECHVPDRMLGARLTFSEPVFEPWDDPFVRSQEARDDE